MSVYQATGIPAVSLPNGASSLPIEIIEMLEPFKRIVFWMDDDVKGVEGGEKFATKLGLARCHLVQVCEHNQTNLTLADVQRQNETEHRH